MKNFIRLLMVLLTALMLPVMVFAQEVAAGVANVLPDPSTWFLSLAALAGAVMTVTQWLKNVLESKGIQTKLLSWLIAVILAFVGWFLELGIFAGLEWYWAAIYALSAGLVANSIVDLNLIQGILKLFKPEKNV